MFFFKHLRSIFLFFVLFLLASSTAAIAGDAGNELRIGFLSENKRVIPFIYQEGRYLFTNVKIPEITITNGSYDTVEILNVILEGKYAGDTFVKKLFKAGAIKKHMIELGARINGLKNGKYPMSLNISYGKFIDPGKNFAETNILSPSAVGVLALWELSWFEHIGREEIDELVFKIFCRRGDKLEMLKFPVKLEKYNQKNKYRFPLKGNILIANMSANYCHHRITNSQEFGFDAICLDEKLSMNKKDQPAVLNDYFSYGQPIYAAADGVVVKIADKFPECASEPAVRKKNPNAMFGLITKIGFDNTVGGNHVIIDHGNGEFGFYAHMCEGTIKVSPGEKVKKGQVIGKLGSTGNSDGPHLHFQVFDSPELTTGNGLPVYFENIPADELGSYRKNYNALGGVDNLRIRLE